MNDLRMLNWLAAVESSRLEAEGAMAEAWSWYESMLRASRHVGKRGAVIERGRSQRL